MHILSQSNRRTVNKEISKAVGVEASLLLSDICSKSEYFAARNELVEYEGGLFFYNTADNIKEDTTLSYYKQKQAIKKLEKMGFIKTVVIGLPAKVHFQINEDKIGNFLNHSIQKIGKLDVKKFETNNNKEIIIKNNNKEIIINTTKSADFDNLPKQKKEITKKIDDIINAIKAKCLELGIAYNSKRDRQFAKNILTAKEFSLFCDQINTTAIDFSLKVIEASVKIGYRRGPCAGPMDIYQNYADVYNQTKQKHTKQITQEPRTRIGNVADY